MRKRSKAFTLLEVIIVIIIVGVLASLALPRFFRVIQYSYSVEAINNFKVLRQVVERVYLMSGGNASCAGTPHTQGETPLICSIVNDQWAGGYPPGSGGILKAQSDELTNAPNSHFSYSVLPWYDDKFGIYAQRNTRDGGTGGEIVYLYTRENVIPCGTGIFQSIGQLTCDEVTTRYIRGSEQ